MESLLIATENKGKVLEIRALLAGLPLTLLTPSDLDLHLNVTENGQTYAENAVLKGIAYAKASGIMTLADDSGLEVDALGGEPGLYSARYAPWPNATDADRRRYLLQNLNGHPRPWQAHFHCSVVIVTPVGSRYFAEGLCPGEIIPEERGTHGFGYDPIFLIPSLGKTAAELDMAQKNEYSHRARAVRAAIPILQELLGSTRS